MIHPRQALFEAGDLGPELPVCDHYAGVEPRMRKSLELQAEMGPVFDLTLDNEDGARVGGELEHAALITELVMSPDNRHGRVGSRIHPVGHPQFHAVLDVLVDGDAPRRQALAAWEADVAQAASPLAAETAAASNAQFQRRQAEIVAAWSATPADQRDPRELERRLDALRVEHFARAR
jgi:citrate lyase subunit beta/citryl-CoA lyase